eukprot:Tbor_TRINITY_DN9991_c0_g1::TRINITY_DN9991_c0_g1_i1::g.17642::m.17642
MKPSLYFYISRRSTCNIHVYKLYYSKVVRSLIFPKIFLAGPLDYREICQRRSSSTKNIVPTPEEVPQCFYCSPGFSCSAFTSKEACWIYAADEFRTVTSQTVEPQHSTDHTDAFLSTQEASYRFFKNQPATDEGACGFSDDSSKIECQILKDFLLATDGKHSTEMHKEEPVGNSALNNSKFGNDSRNLVKPFSRHDVTQVVELGCGTGRYSTLWCEVFPSLKKVVLVEPQEHFLTVAVKRLREYLEERKNPPSPQSSTEDKMMIIPVVGLDARAVEVEVYQMSAEQFLQLHSSIYNTAGLYNQDGITIFILCGVCLYFKDCVLQNIILKCQYILLREDVSVTRAHVMQERNNDVQIKGEHLIADNISFLPNSTYCGIPENTSAPWSVFVDDFTPALAPNLNDTVQRQIQHRSSSLSPLKLNNFPTTDDHVLRINETSAPVTIFVCSSSTRHTLDIEDKEQSQLSMSKTSYDFSPKPSRISHTVPVELCFPVDGSHVRTRRHFEQLFSSGEISDINENDNSINCEKMVIDTHIQWNVPHCYYSPVVTWLLGPKTL